MTTEQLSTIWNREREGIDDEFLQFERVKNKTSNRADLHAFMLLDKLVPYVQGDGNSDIVGSAEHDEIWLSIDLEKLASVITEEQIIELIRCGVRYDESVDCLAMFV